MHQLPLGRLIEAYQRLHTFGMQTQHTDREGGGIKMAEDMYERLVGTVDEFFKLCGEMSLTVTEQAAQAIKHDLRRVKQVDGLPGYMVLQGFDLTRVRSSFENLIACFKFETKSKTMMLFPPEKLKFFEPDEPLCGTDVRAKFPSATYDIDEAGKCLAFGRSTACVFHLMRVMEITLKAISRCLALGVPTNPNWGTWLSPIRAEMQKRRSGWSDFTLFQDCWQRIDAIKDAQRNQTMHVETVYTEEEALLIFKNTEAFLKKVASRMDEHGLPLA